MQSTKLNFLTTPNSFHLNYNTDMPIKAEKNIMILNRISNEERNNNIYNNLDKELNLYLSKIPNDLIRNIITDLSNKKMIFYGLLPIYQNGITGTILFNSNSDELIAIVVEMNNLEIDINDGTITRPSDVIYTIYQQYLRAVTISSMNLILKDDELNSLLEKYFNFLIIKILKLSYLSEKQRILFDVTTSTFFNTYYFNINPNLSFERALTKHCPDKFYDEIKFLISPERMKSYTKFNDLFNAYYDNKAILEDPNIIIRKVLQGLKLYGYIFIGSSLDYLISTACASKYNYSILTSCNIDNKLQSHIENIIIKKYSVKLKTDSNATKYFNTSKGSD